MVRQGEMNNIMNVCSLFSQFLVDKFLVCQNRDWEVELHLEQPGAAESTQLPSPEGHCGEAGCSRSSPGCCHYPSLGDFTTCMSELDTLTYIFHHGQPDLLINFNFTYNHWNIPDLSMNFNWEKELLKVFLYRKSDASFLQL